MAILEQHGSVFGAVVRYLSYALHNEKDKATKSDDDLN